MFALLSSIATFLRSACCFISIFGNMVRRPWILQNHLLHAIQNNDIAMAESLFDQGVDIDSVLYAAHLGKPAICICVERGYYKMAKMLIERGCSLSLTTASGFTPLHLAVMYADRRLVKLLLENRANVRALDGMGQTALHIACSKPSLAIVEELIRMGSDCNKLDDEGRSPLFLSCIQGCSKISICLLQHGAKADIIDSCGNSPLLYAISHPNCMELVKMLVAAGANVNLKNAFDETPVLCLIKSYDCQRRCNIPDDLSVIDFLIANGCKLDIVTSLGQTPLHIAVCQRRVNLSRKLINKGCDVNACDNLGFTPLFYACRDGSRSIALMLVAAGTDLRKQSWLHEEKLIKVCDKELVEWMLEKRRECYTLSEICVLTLRNYFGSNIELAMEQLELPTMLKNLVTLKVYM